MQNIVAFSACASERPSAGSKSRIVQPNRFNRFENGSKCLIRLSLNLRPKLIRRPEGRTSWKRRRWCSNLNSSMPTCWKLIRLRQTMFGNNFWKQFPCSTASPADWLLMLLMFELEHHAAFLTTSNAPLSARPLDPGARIRRTDAFKLF